MTNKELIKIAYELGADLNSVGAMVKALQKGVEIGKAEQKAIDDELLKRVHKGVLDKAIKEKKELIEKACKWLENWMLANEWLTMQESLERFRQAMEE